MYSSEKSYDSLGDSRLAKLVDSGDDRAFETLAARYLGAIAFTARKFSAAGYEHNDFVQEGLLGLLQSCKTYNENAGASFKSYTSVVIERRFISIVRKDLRKKEIPRSSLVSIDDISDAVADFNQTPEQLLLYRVRLEQLVSKLKSELSGLEYKVLMLYCDGRSYREIAEKLAITEKSVDNALQRARKKLAADKSDIYVL